VAYTPKYAPGSLAANELIHTGRELFRGESPPVKVWGDLEKKIKVVGMHGAAASLQIRRIPSGDAMPFGQEENEPESTADVNADIAEQTPIVVKANDVESPQTVTATA